MQLTEGGCSRGSTQRAPGLRLNAVQPERPLPTPHIHHAAASELRLAPSRRRARTLSARSDPFTANATILWEELGRFPPSTLHPFIQRPQPCAARIITLPSGQRA